jgi:hypothetical protein
MDEALEQLIDALLYEGYALYPYTPGATKNATPTPFGIAYPPAYAAASVNTFEHLELRCLLEAPHSAKLCAEVRFLSASGERRAYQAHHLGLAETTVGALVRASLERQSAFELEADVGEQAAGRLRLALGLSAHQLGRGVNEVALRVENRTPCAKDVDRAGALSRSLLSTHPILRVTGGCFVSPLERPCVSVNTFPVLATPTDDAVIGAAIVLPDHPQLAPESRGSLFDSTEIEEALLLHVKTLSDAEREAIERHDPVVREMVARAAAATPDELLALHGRVRLRDPVAVAVRGPASDTPPEPPPDLADPTLGEEEADVEGVRFRRGGKVRLRPPADADLHARLLDGRTATIERIMVDYDGKTHLGVTIDGDPGQELLRESNRFLFFFAPEVEVLQ